MCRRMSALSPVSLLPWNATLTTQQSGKKVFGDSREWEKSEKNRGARVSDNKLITIYTDRRGCKEVGGDTSKHPLPILPPLLLPQRSRNTHVPCVIWYSPPLLFLIISTPSPISDSLRPPPLARSLVRLSYQFKASSVFPFSPRAIINHSCLPFSLSRNHSKTQSTSVSCTNSQRNQRQH